MAENISASANEQLTVDATTRKAENAFSMALVFSGIRCVLMYAILPFVLPAIGVAGNFSAIVDLLINGVAIFAIFYSVRTFWKVDYKYKWHYLPVAGVALLIIGAFMVQDILALMG
jgi:uncharacterized membrane protein